LVMPFGPSERVREGIQREGTPTLMFSVPPRAWRTTKAAFSGKVILERTSAVSDAGVPRWWSESDTQGHEGGGEVNTGTKRATTRPPTATTKASAPRIARCFSHLRFRGLVKEGPNTDSPTWLHKVCTRDPNYDYESVRRWDTKKAA